MNKIYLLLGSNMGDSKKKLLQARQLITKKIGSITRSSDIYQTAAWGNTRQSDFLNQVLIIQSMLPAPEIMKSILGIEQEMGRERTIKNAPRIIDIDILFYNKDIHPGKDLTIPHPALAFRRFVLVPLNQLSPNFVHPVSGKTIHRLLLECPDELDVKKI